MGGSATTTSTQTTSPNPEAMKAYESLFPQAAQIASTPWNPQTEQRVANFSPQQLQSFNQIGNLQGGYVPYLDAATQMTQGAAAPISGQAIQQYMNPYQSQVINATMAQLGQQQGQQLQNLKAGAVAQNALGGNRADMASGYLQGQQNLATGSTLANLNQANYGQALSAAQQDAIRQLSAGQQMAGLGQLGQNLGLQGSQALFGAGQAQQGQQQEQLNAATKNAQQQTMWPYQNLQWLSSLYGGIGPLMGGTTAGTQTQTQSPGAGSYIGGALALMAMFSDKRVKEGIEPIGKSFDGQTIYKFRYKGSPQTHIGMLAQEVEKKHPDAVGSIGGIKTVNYDEATEDAAERGHFADGGSVNGGFGDGADWFPWARIPSPQINLPRGSSGSGGSSGSSSGSGNQSLGDMMKLGQKARGGLSNMLSQLNIDMSGIGAGGAGGAGGMAGLGAGAAGDMSGLGSLFGDLGGSAGMGAAGMGDMLGGLGALFLRDGGKVRREDGGQIDMGLINNLAPGDPALEPPADLSNLSAWEKIKSNLTPGNQSMGLWEDYQRVPLPERNIAPLPERNPVFHADPQEAALATAIRPPIPSQMMPSITPKANVYIPGSQPMTPPQFEAPLSPYSEPPMRIETPAAPSNVQSVPKSQPVEAPTEAPAEPTETPVTRADITSLLETGKANPLEGVGYINKADTDGSHSYGNLGLNSNGSMQQFVKEHGDEFPGLRGKTPGTAAFDRAWTEIANRDGAALHVAELQWREKHVTGRISSDLEGAGVPQDIRNDPRVQAYMSDLLVHQGPAIIPLHAARMKAALAAPGGDTPDGFLTNLSAIYKTPQALKADFPKALRSGAYSAAGNNTRVDGRLAAALGQGAEIDTGQTALPPPRTVAPAATPTAAPPRGNFLTRLFNGQLAPSQPTTTPAPALGAGQEDRGIGGLFGNPLGLSPRTQDQLLYMGLGAMGNTLAPWAGPMQGMQQEREAAALRLQQQLGQQKMELEQHNLMKPVVIGASALGVPIYGQYDPETRSFKPIGGGGQAAAGQTGGNIIGTDLHGAEALKRLDPATASIVKKFGTYEMAPPTPASLRNNPYLLNAMALAEQVYPGFSAQEYGIQYAVKKSFASGEDSKEIKAYNTVMPHLIDAKSTISRLGNTRSPMVNSVMNAVRGQYDEDFQKARGALMSKMDVAMGEVNKATAAKPITVSEQKYWHDRLNQNAAPAELNETLKSFTEMIRSRMNAVADKYNSGMKLHPGMPEYKTGEDLFSDDAKKKYHYLLGDEAAPTAGATPPAAAPANAQAQQQLINLGPDAPPVPINAFIYFSNNLNTAPQFDAKFGTKENPHPSKQALELIRKHQMQVPQ